MVSGKYLIYNLICQSDNLRNIKPGMVCYIIFSLLLLNKANLQGLQQVYKTFCYEFIPKSGRKYHK